MPRKKASAAPAAPAAASTPAAAAAGDLAKDLDPDTATLAQEVATVAAQMTVKTLEEAANAAELLAGIKELKEQITAFFEPMHQAAKTVHSAVIERKKSQLEPVEKAEKRLKDAIDYFVGKVTAEQEAHLRAAVEQLPDNAGAEALELVQSKLVMPVIKGVQIRQSFGYSIDDATQLPEDFLKVVANEEAIAARVQSLGYAARIPGVTVKPKRTIAITG